MCSTPIASCERCSICLSAEAPFNPRNISGRRRPFASTAVADHCHWRSKSEAWMSASCGCSALWQPSSIWQAFGGTWGLGVVTGQVMDPVSLTSHAWEMPALMWAWKPKNEKEALCCSRCHVSFPRCRDSVIVHVVLRASLCVVVGVAKVGIIFFGSEAGLGGRIKMAVRTVLWSLLI